MAISPESRVTKPDSVLVRELSGELVLLNLETESYFGLDEVGARIWAALCAAPSNDQACAELAGEFEVDAQTLQKDVAALVERLSESGLVTIHHPA